MRSLAAVLLLALCPSAFAAAPQFWKVEGAQEFLDGTLDSLSVDQAGHVRLAPASKSLYDPESPDAWCLARDSKGTIYVGSGNEGKIFKIQGGEGHLLYKANELEIHALAVASDGKLYAGTSPNGKVYAIDATGKAQVVFEPTERYIWALAFDAQGVLYVATGAEGKVYRIRPGAKAEALFSSTETHITSLAVDTKGQVFAGTSPGGIVYRIDSSGRVFALYDSPFREIAALEVAPNGTVYAAAVDGEREEPRPAAPVAPASPAPSVSGEVIVMETFSSYPALPPAGTTSSRAPESTRGPAKGAVLAIQPTGSVETLWTSNDEMPHSLLRWSDGVLVGTGNKGKLYLVRDTQTWTMLGSFPEQQVTSLAHGEGGTVLLATSNPGRVYTFGSGLAAKGTFVSKVKDTDTVSTFGRLRWAARVPPGTDLQISTRTGNTQAPDSTWTDWSRPYTKKDGDPVASERARFLQVRAVLIGKGTEGPQLDSIATAYLQRNLRPQIVSITVHPPGEVIQRPLSVGTEVEILGQEPGEAAEVRPFASPRPPAAPPSAYARKLYQKGMQTFSWKAEDPNGDSLVYTVEYRAVEDDHYHLLRKSFTDPVLVWDTSTVPSGRYVIRVTASDSPGNPEGLALQGQKESVPFDVDTTPPSVSAVLLERSPAKVRAVVRDDTSIIRRAEYSLDGARWHEVYPVDGINDGLEETYDITLGELPPGPHVVVVRATDLFGNAATARIDIR